MSCFQENGTTSVLDSNYLDLLLLNSEDGWFKQQGAMSLCHTQELNHKEAEMFHGLIMSSAPLSAW